MLFLVVNLIILNLFGLWVIMFKVWVLMDFVDFRIVIVFIFFEEVVYNFIIWFIGYFVLSVRRFIILIRVCWKSFIGEGRN